MTQPLSASQYSDKSTLVLRVYFALIILGGILTIVSLIQIPTEAKNAAIFGLSKGRILMLAGVLIGILLASGVLITSWVNKPIFKRFEQVLVIRIQHTPFYGLSILFCSLVLFGSAYLILLTPEITEPFTLAYFVRLQPLITWVAVLCAQTLVVLPLFHYGFDLQKLKPHNRIVYQITGIFSLLLLIWILIAQTKLGLTPSDAGAGWNALGSPLLETQAFAAWITAMLYIGLAIWEEKQVSIFAPAHKFRLLRINLLVSIALWAAAFGLWNSIPLTPNWFAAPPRHPNQAIYPNSDAYLYDSTGQTLLTGEGLKTENAPFAIRPLYGLFLAGIHVIGGYDYEPVIWMQVAVLALIPVILYWITLHIHNRVSALIAAFLLIFRETNAIILGSSITTLHSKLLMADLPTTLGVMLLILIFISWLKNPSHRLNLTLVGGGVVGVFMLIRPEFAVLLPFLGLAGLLELLSPGLNNQTDSHSSSSHSKSRELKIWFKGMLFLTLGMALFLLPWIWRNYQLTNTIFLDSPHYRSDLFALRYQEYETENEAIPEKPPESTIKPSNPSGETPLQTSDPLATTIATAPATTTPEIAYQPNENVEAFAGRMFNSALNYAKNNLKAVLYFITNHFLNSQVQSIIYLPATFRLPDSAVGLFGHKDPVKFWEQCCSAENYIRRLPFWFKWDGSLPLQSILPLTINLFLISVGFASAWKRVKFIALLPLFASLGYSLINALVRNSGGRYILPIDWVGILYFSVGLGQLTLWILAYFRGSKLPSAVLGEIPHQTKTGEASLQKKTTLGVAVSIFLLGCLLPLSEKIVTPRYPPELLVERKNKLSETLDLSLESFIEEGGSVVQGSALYPRFHVANQGEAGTRRTPFSPLPFSRFDFYMVGPFNGGIVLAQDATPAHFTNGADVLAIGCPGDFYFDAFVVVIYDPAGNPDQIFLRQPFPETLRCQ